MEAPGCEVVFSIDEARSRIKKEEEAFIIGGASIYKQFLPFADKLYITQIDHAFEADIFFPEVDLSKYRLVSKEKGLKDKENPYDYFFLAYEKIRS
jgi:dihydrofolate reductase